MAKILIVDDEQDIRDYFTALLQDNGYETVTAADGIEGEKLVKSEKPDLVILDMVMPKETGVKFYRNLKSNEGFSKLPIIISTGITHLKELFVLDRKSLPKPEFFFEKPINEEEFLTAVKSLIG